MRIFIFCLLLIIGIPNASAAALRGIQDISPPLTHAELKSPKLLFVDLNCLLCEQVLKGVKNDPAMKDVRLVFVIAISQSKESQAKMLWHLSKSALYGESQYGCQKNCANISSVGAEPKSMPFLDQQIEWLKRRALIGQNTDALINLFAKNKITGRVPAFYDGTLTIIDSAATLKEQLHKKVEDTKR